MGVEKRRCRCTFAPQLCSSAQVAVHFPSFTKADPEERLPRRVENAPMQKQFRLRHRPGSNQPPDLSIAAWIWLLATLAGVLVAAGLVAAARLVVLPSFRMANGTSVRPYVHELTALTGAIIHAKCWADRSSKPRRRRSGLLDVG